MQLAAGSRVVVPDVEAAAALAGSEDLHEYRRSGLRAVQSTALLTVEGRVAGMLSTHWRSPHDVRAEELRRIDLLVGVVRAQQGKLLDWAKKSDIARHQYHRKEGNGHLVTSVERLGMECREIAGPGRSYTQVVLATLSCHEPQEAANQGRQRVHSPWSGEERPEARVADWVASAPRSRMMIPVHLAMVTKYKPSDSTSLVGVWPAERVLERPEIMVFSRVGAM